MRGIKTIHQEDNIDVIECRIMRKECTEAILNDPILKSLNKNLQMILEFSIPKIVVTKHQILDIYHEEVLEGRVKRVRGLITRRMEEIINYYKTKHD